MFTIANQQLTFSVPDFFLTSPLSQNREMTNVSGTFFGLTFSVSCKELVIDGVSYDKNHISHGQPIPKLTDKNYKKPATPSVIHKGLEFIFYKNPQDPSGFILSISQGHREIMVTPELIYFKRSPASSIHVYPNGSDCDPNDLAEVYLKVEQFHQDGRPTEQMTYNTEYLRKEDGSIEKIAEKWESSYSKKFPMDLTEANLQQLFLDRLGFSDLQITVE